MFLTPYKLELNLSFSDSAILKLHELPRIVSLTDRFCPVLSLCIDLRNSIQPIED